MSEIIDPLRKFYIAVQLSENGISDIVPFQSKDAVETYAQDNASDPEPSFILCECLPYLRAFQSGVTLESITPKRQRRKRKANGAGEPAQVETAPADPAEPPLPLDVGDSPDIPPFLRR